MTVVVVGGKHVVAQYGQWDGHPDGQGTTALAFCRNHLRTSSKRKKVLAQLTLVRFMTEADGPRIEAELKDKEILNSPARWIELGFLGSREHGATVLDKIMGFKATKTGAHEMLLRDEFLFAADSLFCEWAYVIDLDKNTFEVYRGFNKEPVPAGERFASLPKAKSGEYYPVRHAITYSLDKLPTAEAFLKYFHDLNEAENAADEAEQTVRHA